MAAVVKATKNEQGRFECPLPECDRKGGKGLPTPAALAMHVKGAHRALWDKLYVKEHGEAPYDSPKAAVNGKPKKRKYTRRAETLTAGRFSARPKIDARMQVDTLNNSIATMEAAAEIMALPSVQALTPALLRGLFQALHNVSDRKASALPA